jgi:hypothetical protein
MIGLARELESMADWIGDRIATGCGLDHNESCRLYDLLIAASVRADAMQCTAFGAAADRDRAMRAGGNVVAFAVRT